MRAIDLALLVGVALLPVACELEKTAEEEPFGEGVPGEWPVARVVDHLQYGDLVIYPDPAALWTKLVDLSIFEGFWPDMTGEDAVRAFGPADDFRDQRGEKFWTYRRPGGRVIVAYKSMGSLFGGWWWRLAAELDPPVPPAELLHSSIVGELPDETDQRYTVTIMNNDRDDRAPAAWIYIEDGRVVRIDISPQGAKGPPLGQPYPAHQPGVASH